MTVDTAYGGDSFVVVDAADLGFADHAESEAKRRSPDSGVRITDAANEQLGFCASGKPGLESHLLLCVLRSR